MSDPTNKSDDDDDDFYNDIESLLSQSARATSTDAVVVVTAQVTPAAVTNVTDSASLIADIDKCLDEDDDEEEEVLGLLRLQSGVIKQLMTI